MCSGFANISQARCCPRLHLLLAATVRLPTGLLAHIAYITPWALADVARVALVHGTEFNRTDATERDLQVILAAFDTLDDPFLQNKDLRAFMLRKAGEQLAWQVSDYQTMARTVALFTQTKSDRQLRYLIPGWDNDVFGYSLREYIGTAQLAWASAIYCSGFFDPNFFDTPDGKVAAQHVARSTVVEILDKHFAGDTAAFRAEEALVARRSRNLDPQLRRYTYNPLRGRPLLTDYGSNYFCPVPQLINSKVSPLGIYFTCLSHFEPGFADDVGHLFEQYVGRQLTLLPDATILPEILYKEHKSEARSIDWFVIFDELVLLVEVKSAIPTEPVRLGTPDAAVEIAKKLEVAYKQIDRTAFLIAEQHPAFRQIPNDRPVLGVVVTLEPYHLANNEFFRNLLPATDISISLGSIAEVEELVTVDDSSIATLLLERETDPQRSTWALADAFTGHHHCRNTVLDAAWDATPWASANRGR